MVALKYRVIKSKSQHKEYSRMLEELVTPDFKSKEMKDEIELLTLLIEKWDNYHERTIVVDKEIIAFGG